MYEMSSVELRRKIHGELKLSECLADHGCVRGRTDEIPTQADEHLGVAPHHRFQSAHYVMSVLPRWVEAKYLLQSIQEFLARSLRDAHCAITLNV